MPDDFVDPDMFCGCDEPLPEEEALADEDLDLVILTGASKDLDEIEKKVSEYEELFSGS